MLWKIIGNIIMWPSFATFIWLAYVSKTPFGTALCIVIAVAIIICIVVTIKDIRDERKS